MATSCSTSKTSALPPTESSGSPDFIGPELNHLSYPSLGDVDGDGDLDVMSGEINGTFYYLNNFGSSTSFLFQALVNSGNPLNGQDVGSNAAPAFGDLDSDGDLDLVSGDSTGAFSFFENFVPQTPSALELTGGANPLNGQDVGSFSSTALGDLDGDGDRDLVAGVGGLGSEDGTFAYFENTRSAKSPAFAARTGTANPLDGQDAGSSSRPALGDLDGDGDLDLIAGEHYGALSYFENTGSATSPIFVPRTGTANPLDGEDVEVAAPSLGDLDGDGDLDLVVGEFNGIFDYYENTGDAASPVFVARTGAANPLNGKDVGLHSKPVVGDFDGDGDLDLLSGELEGAFFYFRNTGSATSPAFVQLVGTGPLGGEDVGQGSTPTAGDLDGDGDLDVVASETDGTFHTYYLPEPARGWLLAAGIAVLEWLRRRRSRDG